MRREPLGLAQFNHRRDVFFADGVGVDDLYRCGQRYALRGSHVLDRFALAEQDAVGDAFFFAGDGGVDRARLVSFRQYDAFDLGARFLDQLVAESRRRELGGFRQAKGGRDGAGVQVFGNGFDDQAHAFDVVTGHGARHLADLARRAVGIAGRAQDGDARTKHGADQLHHLRIDDAGMSQQNAGDRNAAADRQGRQQQDIVAVGTGDDQRTGLEIRDVLNGLARGENNALHTTRGEFAFGSNVRLEMAGNVEHARRVKLRRFINDAPKPCQFVSGAVDVEIFRRHVEHRAGDIAARARKLAGADLQVFNRRRLRRVGHQHHVGLEAVGDVDVQLRSKGMRRLGMQALNDQDIGIGAGVHAQRDDVFEQVGFVI